MASRNHHDHVAREYLESLGNELHCVKDKCSGRLIPVLASYRPGERAQEELECTLCGKVVRQKLATFAARVSGMLGQEKRHVTFHIPRPPQNSIWRRRDH